MDNEGRNSISQLQGKKKEKHTFCLNYVFQYLINSITIFFLCKSNIGIVNFSSIGNFQFQKKMSNTNVHPKKLEKCPTNKG